jgi:hypothetical protein
MGSIGCLETSVNYHYTLRNSPEEGSSHLLRGGSQKAHILYFDLMQPYAPLMIKEANEKHDARGLSWNRYGRTGQLVCFILVS